MSKQSPALWMKFWWRKLCKANQLLMNMRTNMKFRSEASLIRKFHFREMKFSLFQFPLQSAANLNIGHRLPIFIVFAFFPVFFDFFSGGEIIPSVQFFFHFIFKPLSARASWPFQLCCFMFCWLNWSFFIFSSVRLFQFRMFLARQI